METKKPTFSKTSVKQIVYGSILEACLKSINEACYHFENLCSSSIADAFAPDGIRHDTIKHLDNLWEAQQRIQLEFDNLISCNYETKAKQ